MVANCWDNQRAAQRTYEDRRKERKLLQQVDGRHGADFEMMLWSISYLLFDQTDLLGKLTPGNQYGVMSRYFSIRLDIPSLQTIPLFVGSNLYGFY